MTQDQLDRRAAQAADERIAAEEGWALLREMDARNALSAARWEGDWATVTVNLARLAYVLDRPEFSENADKWATARTVDRIQSEFTDWRM